MTKPSKNYGFVRCDSEFEAVGQDLDMSTMGIVKGIPMYQMPDISRELMLLEEQLKFSAKGKEDKHMLAIGTKVIVRTCDDYGGRHCGRVGMVCKHFAKDKKVGVMFEGDQEHRKQGRHLLVPGRQPDALQGAQHHVEHQRREERDFQRRQDHCVVGGWHQDDFHLRRE